MHVVAVIGQKGGSGKTTLACQLAVESCRNGHATVVLDCDPQASAVRLLGARESPVVQDCSYAALPRALDAVRRVGADLVVIDTPPQIEAALVRAVEVADLVLAPIRPTGLDLGAFAGLRHLLALRQLTPVLVLSQTAPAIDGRLARAALLADGCVVARTELKTRVAYHRSLTRGQGVAEFAPRSTAAREITALWQELRLPACHHASMSTS